jgi:hypothetical protein
MAALLVFAVVLQKTDVSYCGRDLYLGLIWFLQLRDMSLLLRNQKLLLALGFSRPANFNTSGNLSEKIFILSYDLVFLR